MSHTTGDRSHKGLNNLPPIYQSEIDPDTARHALAVLTRLAALDLAPMLGLVDETAEVAA